MFGDDASLKIIESLTFSMKIYKILRQTFFLLKFCPFDVTLFDVLRIPEKKHKTL